MKTEGLHVIRTWRQVHQAGFLALIQHCYEFGVNYVTIYAFSMDNFKNSPGEVERLMELILEKIKNLLNEKNILDDYRIKINFMGNLDLLSIPIKLAAEKIMLLIVGNKKKVLYVLVPTKLSILFKNLGGKVGKSLTKNSKPNIINLVTLVTSQNK